jgi:4-aminobutyrate aminotransferase
MFAMEHFGVSPDLMTMAKSMAGGTTLSAVVGRTAIMDAPAPGGLGGTYKTMGDVRGLGAMIACEFVNPATGAPDADLTKQIQQAALKKGLLLLTCGVYGNVLRFLFPLTIEDSVFDEALAILDDVIGA